ncbi:MAG: metallophosphoesterase [Rhodoblastus sp.]|nr:metallophosphoesterase [Rhodoblastus sp.]
MITRRALLRLAAGALVGGAGVAAYGLVGEPFFRPRTTRYAFTPPGWPPGLRLRLAIVADLHACDPWMRGDRVAAIVDQTNDSGADCILLLGDYIATHRFQVPIPLVEWTRELARLRAPLGVHAVLGNHDWWNDPIAVKRGDGLPVVGLAMQDAGLRLYQNDALRLEKDGRPFWIAGLGDQIAFIPVRGWRAPRYGIDDLPATLALARDDAPLILMAHEPDIFPTVPGRVAVTISGHTHGGQLNLFGWRPVVPSRYGQRYAYGHKVEDGRNIVVSGGLGASIVPMRIGSPPEIVTIDLG